MVDFDLTNFPISHERPAIDDGWTWKDRIRPNVVLFAPETGDRFEGFWIGGDRSFNKKLGLFDFPNIGGTVGQDLAKVGTRYPIQFFFAGKDHDRQANQFFKACANYGLWEVEHPLFGYFGGLLVSVRQSFNITDNANATSIDCEFVETIDPNSLLTQAEFSEFLNEDIYDLSDLSATDFANRAKKFPANALAKLADCVEAIQKAVDTVLGPIAALNNTVYNSLQAVQVAIQDTLRAVIFQPLALAGQIQQTIALPGLIANDIKARLTGYANLMEQMFAPENSATRVVRADPGYFNVALAREQYGTAIIAHAGRAIGEAQINSRQEAIDLGNQYWAMIDSFIRNNDEAQKKFGTEVLQDQFIGMEETYAATMKYALLVTQRLIRSIWDANVERKYEIATPVSPYTVFMAGAILPSRERSQSVQGRMATIRPATSKEFQSVPEADGPGDRVNSPIAPRTNPRIPDKAFEEQYDEFARSNQLEGTEFLVLPPQRQVKFYG